MPPILLGEYRNKNSQRKYPFADDVTLEDTNGNSLPVDFLIDAFLYPIDLTGAVYLSHINISDGIMDFSEEGGDQAFGYAEFATGDEVAYVYDYAYNRQIGLVVFGSGLTNVLAGDTERVFDSSGTQLCPTTYIALNQQGVRGFLLEDGTLLTGDIVFEGYNGVSIQSYVDGDGNSVIRFDVVGVPQPTEEDCVEDQCAIIKTICFERIAGSIFDISEFEECGVNITAHGFTLDDICEFQRDQRLPDANGILPLKSKDDCDPCEGGEPEPPTDPGEDVSFCIDVADCDIFNILAMSTLDASNPVSIDENHLGLNKLSNPIVPQAPRETGDVNEAVEDWLGKSRPPDGLRIGLKGLPQFSSGL